MVDAAVVDPRTTVAYRLESVTEDLGTHLTALGGWYTLRGLDSADPRRLSYEEGRALDCLWYDTMEILGTQLEKLKAILEDYEDSTTSAD